MLFVIGYLLMESWLELIIGLIEAVLEIADRFQGQGEYRFKSGAYTTVFEYFESVFNTALGRRCIYKTASSGLL
jgi:hypothetical protein